MITVSGFLGIDKKNEKVPGMLPNARNVDFGNPIGRATKRGGLYQLIDSLGSGGIKGQFTYKHPDGDIALIAHGDKLYKLIGTDGVINSDFNTGTHDNTIVDAGVLKNQLEIEEITQTAQTDILEITEGITVKQTFKVDKKYITAIGLNVESFTPGASLTIKIGNTSKAVEITQTGWNKIIFDTPVESSDINTLEITSDVSVNIYINNVNPYLDGEVYINDTKYPGTDLAFKVYTHDGPNSSWTSPVYDLRNTPTANIITIVKNVPAGASVKIKVRGSSNNSDWGIWQETTEKLPMIRFIQIMIEGDAGDFATQWSVTSFTISYTSGYTNPVEILSGLSGNKVRFAEWQEKCYFCDGVKNYVYDGINIRELGVNPPDTAPTVSASGSGSFNGKYKYKITFVNSEQHESNSSPASNEVNASSNAQFDLTDIPVKTGHKRRIYRTKADIDVYYYVTELNEIDTTYTDTRPDDLLTLEMEEDNDKPLAGDIIEFHKNYMFIIPHNDNTKLYYSKVGNPDAMPSLFYKQLPGKTNTIKSYSDQLVASGELFTVAFSGSIFHNTAIDDTVQRKISNVGALSHEGVVECLMADVGVVLVMPTREGYKYLTPGLHEFSLLQRPFSYEVNDYFERCITAGKAGNIQAIEHENVLYIALTYYEEGEIPIEENNIILPFNLLTKKWYDRWDIPAAGFNKIGGMLFVGDPYNGIVYEMLKGSDDAGKPIHYIVDIPVYVEQKTKFRRMRLVVGKNSVTDTLQVHHQVNTSDKTTITMPGPVSDWNPDILGHYNNPVMKSKRMYPKLKNGSFYVARIEDNSKNPFSVFGIEIEG